jgi:hypothetical protein
MFKGIGVPGSTRAISPGVTKCEGYNCVCPEYAIIRLQGETDSFGAEYFNYCEACYKACMDAEKDIEDNCDWCKEMAKVYPVRDYSEGMSGPVYYVCMECSTKQDKEALEELKWMEENL